MKTIFGTIALAALLSWLGPAIDDNGYEHAIAADLEQAQRDDKARERFERAAQAACGENAGWYEVSSGVIDCSTHRGYRTRRAVRVSF